MTYFYNFETPCISMEWAKAFKFGIQIDRQAYKPKMQKLVKRGVAYVT